MRYEFYAYHCNRYTMSSILIKKRTVLSDDTHLLERIDFEKRNRHDEPEMQHREIYFRPDAVSVLLADHRQRSFLLTRQFRLPVYLHEDGDGYLLEACAGVMDDGETPEETVIRETLEETGYHPLNLLKIGCTYVSPAFCMERIHLFLAGIDLQDKKQAGGGVAAEGEEIEPVVISYEKAKQMLQAGEIRDVKTMALLQHFLLRYPDA